MRGWLLERLFTWSAGPYARLAKRGQEPWPEDVASLLARPPGTLGHALGVHLAEGGFSLLPCLEDHDVFHVLTDVGVQPFDEVRLQFLLTANGKHSLYGAAVMGIGGSLYLDRWPALLRAWRRGRRAAPFATRFTGRQALAWLDTPLAEVRPADLGVASASVSGGR